jgi:hypothetical protein
LTDISRFRLLILGIGTCFLLQRSCQYRLVGVDKNKLFIVDSV